MVRQLASASSTSRRRPWQRIWFLSALVMLAVGAAILWFAFSSPATSQQSRLADSALAYGRRYMVWSRGPDVQSTRVVPLRRLAGTLAASGSASARQSVNVADLLHRFGPNREVALVVLHGVYNSLPPDEGVLVNGDVVVVVDAQSNRVLLLTV